MLWTVPCFFFFVVGVFMDCVSAGEQCREERSINGMALQGFVFKKFSVRAFHQCDISCERELTCQSYNYVVGENSCELNNRTKEARPEHFRSDPTRVYLRRLSNRAPLGSIPELPAHSCSEIKASEGKGTISSKYWLDPSRNGTAVLLHCDMNLEDIDECTNGTHSYDVNSVCNNTRGSYNCTSKDGFYGDGINCTAVFQCPPSWTTFNRSCYKLFMEERNWSDAKTICSANNAQLVNIASADENNFIRREFLKGRVDYWIGLTDSETEGIWKWTNGATLTGYTNWGRNQPNDHTGQDCGGIRNGIQGLKGEWHDNTCSYETGFICELI